MAGTTIGGKAAAKTNKERYGADFYGKIGSIGGKKGTTGGFHSAVCNCEYTRGVHKKAMCAGAKGGRISRRTKRSA